MEYLGWRGGRELVVINARIMAERRASSGRAPMPRPYDGPPAHGSEQRFNWDRNRGIRPCPACNEAHARYTRPLG